MIDEKLLIELFEQRDRKRREALFELFRENLFASLTRARVADMINAKLGRPGLIKAEDVRYCRFYFKDKKTGRIHWAVEKTIRKPDRPQDAENFQPNAFKVTDPDEIKLEDQFNFKSKHSNKQ